MAAKAAESIMDTLGSALEAHQDVFDAAKGSLADLPEKRGSLPLTFTEATAYIQHKEDEKRRREAKKDRQKQRSGPPPAETIPGLIPGPPDSSPFWLVTEVRNLCGFCDNLLTTASTMQASALSDICKLLVAEYSSKRDFTMHIVWVDWSKWRI